MILTYLLFFVCGAGFGSFAGLLIHRITQDKPLKLMGRSRCGACSKVIPFYLNVPIFSWFFLKGRCRFCKAAFSFRYPLVEFLSALIFVLLYALLGRQWFLLEALIFSWGLLVVSFIDLDIMILPDSFTLSGIALGLLGAALNPERSFMAAFAGAFLGGFIFFSIAKIYFSFRSKEGLGGGDIKLAGWIGAVLGWQALPFVILFASFSGLIAGLIFLQAKKKSFESPIPFGPFLALGAFLAIVVSKGPAVLPAIRLF